MSLDRSIQCGYALSSSSARLRLATAKSMSSMVVSRPTLQRMAERAEGRGGAVCIREDWTSTEEDVGCRIDVAFTLATNLAPRGPQMQEGPGMACRRQGKEK